MARALKSQNTETTSEEESQTILALIERIQGLEQETTTLKETIKSMDYMQVNALEEIRGTIIMIMLAADHPEFTNYASSLGSVMSGLNNSCLMASENLTSLSEMKD